MEILLNNLLTSVKGRLLKHKSIHGFKETEVNDRLDLLKERAEYLKKNFCQLEKGPQWINEIFDVIVNALIKYEYAYISGRKWLKEFEVRQQKALDGIDALLALDEPYEKGDLKVYINYWEDPIKDQILHLKSLVKETGIDKKEIFDERAERLRGTPKSTKPAVRRFLIPYQIQVDACLKRLGMKPGDRYELIADMFYGAGIEKNQNSADELRKAIFKIKKIYSADNPTNQAILS